MDKVTPYEDGEMGKGSNLDNTKGELLNGNELSVVYSSNGDGEGDVDELIQMANEKEKQKKMRKPKD